MRSIFQNELVSAQYAISSPQTPLYAHLFAPWQGEPSVGSVAGQHAAAVETDHVPPLHSTSSDPPHPFGYKHLWPSFTQTIAPFGSIGGHGGPASGTQPISVHAHPDAVQLHVLQPSLAVQTVPGTHGPLPHEVGPSSGTASGSLPSALVSALVSSPPSETAPSSPPCTVTTPPQPAESRIKGTIENR
jgi:hypothetical protein